MSALAADTETQGSGSQARLARRCLRLPATPTSAADSVAISGQTGTVSPLAGLDMDRIRDAIETLRAQG